MDQGPIHALNLRTRLAVQGVPATVTRPAPDNTPIVTRGIWLASPDESQPVGVDFQRREPRRVFVVSRVDVPTAPRGTTITAPEPHGGAVNTWEVDGLDLPNTPDQFRLIVKAA